MGVARGARGSLRLVTRSRGAFVRARGRPDHFGAVFFAGDRSSGFVLSPCGKLTSLSLPVGWKAYPQPLLFFGAALFWRFFRTGICLFPVLPRSECQGGYSASRTSAAFIGEAELVLLRGLKILSRTQYPGRASCAKTGGANGTRG